jgi:hypothetical protein
MAARSVPTPPRSAEELDAIRERLRGTQTAPERMRDLPQPYRAIALRIAGQCERDVSRLLTQIERLAAERDALRVALLVIRDFRRLDGGDSVDQLRAVARAALEGAAGGERG